MVLEELFGPDVIGYDAPLELARRWRLFGDPARREKAAALLDELTGKYPLAVDVAQELVLVQMDVCPERVLATLQRAEEAFPDPSEELLCRFGRLYKDQGDGHRGRKEYGHAERDYRSSAERYEAGYRIRKGHYPGINLATLLLVRAGLAHLTGRRLDEIQLLTHSDALARDLLASRQSWPDDQLGDRDVWHPATEAEARLLLRDWAGAAEVYRSITDAPDWAYNTMQKQVQRILDAWRVLGQNDFGPFDDAAMVFPQRQKQP